MSGANDDARSANGVSSSSGDADRLVVTRSAATDGWKEQERAPRLAHSSLTHK